LLINTGQYAVSYTAQTSWQVGGGSGQPPGVPFGNVGELSGVLNPGDDIDITSVYVGGITAVLGSSHPFVDPDAGKYVDVRSERLRGSRDRVDRRGEGGGSAL
jgi:hypothetical protein